MTVWLGQFTAYSSIYVSPEVSPLAGVLVLLIAECSKANTFAAWHLWVAFGECIHQHGISGLRMCVLCIHNVYVGLSRFRFKVMIGNEYTAEGTQYISWGTSAWQYCRHVTKLSDMSLWCRPLSNLRPAGFQCYVSSSPYVGCSITPMAIMYKCQPLCGYMGESCTRHLHVC